LASRTEDFLGDADFAPVARERGDDEERVGRVEADADQIELH
jgi:hypothetical protein